MFEGPLQHKFKLVGRRCVGVSVGAGPRVSRRGIGASWRASVPKRPCGSSRPMGRPGDFERRIRFTCGQVRLAQSIVAFASYVGLHLQHSTISAGLEGMFLMATA